MKLETIYWPEKLDKEIALLVVNLPALDEEQLKSARMVINGSAGLSSERIQKFYSALSEGMVIYQSHIDQNIKIGGFIHNQKTVDDIKQNWTHLKNKIREYLNGRDK